MGRVKEAIMTVEDMFNEEFKKFEDILKNSLEDILKNSLEDFRKNGCGNDNAMDEAELQMAVCEAKLQAYARIAKELFDDESLEERYYDTVNKYANDALKILFKIEK